MATQRVNLTDRAKRYRAQNNVTGPKKCVICGSRSDIQVMHLSGNESDGERANLAYGCRSCNGKLAAAFKTIGAGRPTNQYNPAAGRVPTFEQYKWAVTHHTRGEHDEGGAVIHATPKHKRIEYAKRIAAFSGPARRAGAAQRRADFEDRWNPPLVVPPPGNWCPVCKKWASVDEKRGVFKRHGERYRACAGTGKAATPQYFDRANPWPFSKPDARRTTPATGGIAHHMAKAGKRGTAGPVDSGTHKGYKISRTSDGEFFSSLDPQSWFETKRQTKEHIDRYLKGRANPGTLEREKVGRAILKKMDALQKRWKSASSAGSSTVDIERKLQHLDSELKTLMRSNPAAASADVFEEFHGFKPSEVVTVTKHVHHHEHLAALGKLVLLEVYGVDKQGHKISGFKNAILACNEDRNQLFIEGGDQTVDLSDFGISKGHETETLGKVTNIGYQTNKTHLGDEGGNAVYVHKFRSTNQGGKHVTVKIARCPDLIYDVRNEQLLISGGSYEILAEGINK